MRVCQFHHFGALSQNYTKDLLPSGGADQVRTDDPHNAIVVLYQLSYDPNNVAHHAGVEPATS